MDTQKETSTIAGFEFVTTVTLGKKVAKKVKVITRELKKGEARTTFPYRPLSKYAESRFGGDHLYDDVCLLLNGLAVRCTFCKAPTKIEHLESGVCPDCDGRSEYNGTDPHASC